MYCIQFEPSRYIDPTKKWKILPKIDLHVLNRAATHAVCTSLPPYFFFSTMYMMPKQRAMPTRKKCVIAAPSTTHQPYPPSSGFNCLFLHGAWLTSF